MNIITPIVLLIISIGLFFGYINPQYRGTDNPQSIQKLQEEKLSYDTALASTTEIIQKRDSLISKKKDISQTDLDRLEKLMPDNVDNVHLILEMDTLAKKYSDKGLKNPSINKTVNTNSGSDNGGQVSNQPVNEYNYLTVGFTISTTYDKFIEFLKDLESNLRLADVTTVAFTANDTGTYDFAVTVKTYWLK